MTDFKIKGSFTTDSNQRIQLRYDDLPNGRSLEQLQNSLEYQFLAATKILRYTISVLTGELSNTNIDRLLRIYFFEGLVPKRGEPAPMSKTNYMLIKSRLVLVQGGLCANKIRIKTGLNVGKKNEDGSRDRVSGQVIFNYLGDTSPSKPDRSYHNYVLSLNDNIRSRVGAIKLCIEEIGTLRGVHALIHEACHKFFGASDEYYLNSDGSVQEEITSVNPRTAMINADTYAMFAIACFKSRL